MGHFAPWEEKLQLAFLRGLSLKGKNLLKQGSGAEWTVVMRMPLNATLGNHFPPIELIKTQ